MHLPTVSARVLAATITLAALSLPLSLAPAAAEQTGGVQTWAVTPANAEGPDSRSQFEYIVQPGEDYEDFVAVRNLGEGVLTLELSAQDARQTDGDFELLGPDDTDTRIGAWLDLGERTVTIPPRSSVVVPFTLHVPNDAEPGDHAGGIVAVSVLGEGDDTAVQYRVGARVHARVAGPIDTGLAIDPIHGAYAGRLNPVRSGDLTLVSTAINTGNVRLSAELTLTAVGLFGLWRSELDLDGIAELLPEGAITLEAVMPEVPPLGPIWVTVAPTEVVSLGQDVTEITAIESRTSVVWAVPWMLLAILALLAIAAAVAIVNLRRRRAHRAAPQEEETPADGVQVRSAP